MSGPAPKPAALKRLAGNPGKRRLNADPVTDDAKPTCPSWLDKDAKAEWRATCARLHRAGIVKSVDRSILAAYCMAYSRWKRFEKVVKDSGPVLKGESGNYYMSPAVLAAQSAMKEMVALAVQLGMTPSARSRLQIAPPAKEKSLADILFESANANTKA